MNWQPIETAPRDGTWVLVKSPAITENGDCSDSGYAIVRLERGFAKGVGQWESWSDGHYSFEDIQVWKALTP